jgi:hypothetical protein
VARDVLVDRARTVAGQGFDGVGGCAVELGPVDLVEAEQKPEFRSSGGFLCMRAREIPAQRDFVGPGPPQRLDTRFGLEVVI